MYTILNLHKYCTFGYFVFKEEFPYPILFSLPSDHANKSNWKKSSGKRPALKSQNPKNQSLITVKDCLVFRANGSGHPIDDAAKC